MIVTLGQVQNCLRALDELPDYWHDQDDPPPTPAEEANHEQAVEWLKALEVELLAHEDELEAAIRIRDQALVDLRQELKESKKALREAKATNTKVKNLLKVL